MKYLKRFPILLFVILFTVIAVNALTVEKATLEELTTESNLVVYGKVISKKSIMENNYINTYLTVEVYDVVRGELNKNQVTVKQMGGTVGEISDEVAGSPKFYEGDEVFFFLVNWKGNYWIHSIALGAYSVIEVDGVKYAVNGFNDVKFSEPLYKKQGEDLKGQYELSELASKVKSIQVEE